MMVSRRTYAGRAVRLACKQAAGIGPRIKDRLQQTYQRDSHDETCQLSYLKMPPLPLLTVHKIKISGLASNYIAHRFDLLGSGWVQVQHGMNCRGVEGFRYQHGAAIDADKQGRWLSGRINRSNLAESQRIWRMIRPGYIPIDWHRDFKSGYRWSENDWYLDIRYGHMPGVDVKAPWELARMQHLPQLAFACALAKGDAEGLQPAHCYVNEFRNQVLDFIATNPPRFGVNWRSAMEVAIRAANLAVAADLFRAGGAGFDAQFQGVFARSLFEHGLHIEANLEWDPQVRGNHYLANVAGLLFIAAYLPCAPKTDAWLAFAVRELVGEAEFQYAPDGTHREASTSYHRLTAEIMAYATALVLALPSHKREALETYDNRLGPRRPRVALAPVPLYPIGNDGELVPFPRWYFERLERMGEFAAHITKPDGHVPQIGDNDSGRFLRIDASYRQLTVAQARVRYTNLADYDDLPDESPYWDEDHLDHRGLIAGIGALLRRDDLLGSAGDGRLDAEIIHGLTGGVSPNSDRQQHSARGAKTVSIGCEDKMRALREELRAQRSVRSYHISADADGGDLRDGVVCYGYPGLGLYVLRSRRLYLAIRCGSFGLVGNGGHAHHDQLSIELSVDGHNLILDPGTYLYSPLKNRREQYRDANAHFAPHVQGCRAKGAGPGLFQMRDRADAACLYFGPQGFAGCHRAYGVAVYRVIEIGADAIQIIDGIKGEGDLQRLTPAFGWRCGWRESLPHSPGYGIIARDPQAMAR